MSDPHHTTDHDAHAAPSASGLKKIATILVLLGLPVLVVGSLVGYYKAQTGGQMASDMSEHAVAMRIQKVGRFQLGAASREPKTGEEVFKAQCTTCHTAGLVGAPKFSDAAAWAPRIATGYEALLNSALKGKGNMAAQGGGAFADFEVGRGVVYMANAAGAKFEEPKAPESAEAAAPGAAASEAK
ncbi:MAG: cytochrome c5 family protein [Comamonadaceae bacterium CG_4_9_14_3_um_filter_60_33]|nr:MAG: cytochrome c5 family protein [Comamonadaceae bacterium CG2_30_59_20]PIY30228.1 MAG: cytochrome c5 family protein [Comamonadaceae bacterium CG_4_10_14_3_um_filter_60_42]PJB46492.1 MAG: cytochrome c5 family protein [Comamonadaceae bacterium CG_4_9_14_3_um_filter_60_33]